MSHRLKLRYINSDLVGYYEIFPPKRMSVSTKTVEVADPSGNKILKRILVADKDFTAGEVVYTVTCFSISSHSLDWLTELNRSYQSLRFWTRT